MPVPHGGRIPEALTDTGKFIALFLNLMHEAIKQALKDEADEAISAEAVQRQSGWLHIQGKLVPALRKMSNEPRL